MKRSKKEWQNIELKNQFCNEINGTLTRVRYKMSTKTSKEYNITPVAKVRMTQRDRWHKRPATTKYWTFKDELRALGATFDNGEAITFIIPMPESWSKKKKELMNGTPHQQRGDIDNYLKAYFDCIFDDDSHIYKISGLEKYWGYKGKIIVRS